MQDSPTRLSPREAPLWRLPEVERALAEASDAWASDGAAAALSPLRRANRLLQTTGHLYWHRRGERLLVAVAEAAHGGAAGTTGPVRNALREFERQIWQAGVPAGAEGLWDDPDPGDADPAVVMGWPVAAARAPALSSRAIPLRQRFERDLLDVLRGPQTGAGAAMARMAATARELYALVPHPYDLWRLAAACLNSLVATPPGLREKRLCARLNLLLAHQLKPDAQTREVEQMFTNEALVLLARHVCGAPIGGADVLTDFGLLQCLILPPAFDLPDESDADARAWQPVGPLSVRLGAWQLFLDKADAWLPALPDPDATLALARGARQIGLAPVARLAAALVGTADSARRHGIAMAPYAQAIDALRGMLHQFAAQAYPEAQASLVTELARSREAMLQR